MGACDYIVYIHQSEDNSSEMKSIQVLSPSDQDTIIMYYESFNGTDVLKAKSRVKGAVLELGTNMSSSSENALCLFIVLSSDWIFSQVSNMADPEA